MRAMRSKPLALLCLAAGIHAAGPAAADEAGERALQAQIEAARRQVMELEMAVEREKRSYPPAGDRRSPPRGRAA